MAHLALWTLLQSGQGVDALPALATPRSLPESPTFTVDGSDDQQEGCHCSKATTLLRALHIEGLPPTMTAAELSTLMAPYGNVQYAEAAPEAVKNESGELVRRLHCYVVFTDHAGACQARRILQLTEQAAVLAGAADVMRVRFCKPQNVTALCTPTFRAFVTAQWAQSAAVAKASPEYKKALCRVNALFVSKLHQHITTARLNSLFGKFGPMIACEVQYHSDGRSAGHGVVIYETIEDAEKALMGTNGYRLEGRTIEVTPLRLKKLPSKLEHLKHKIKRQPLSGDMSGSEDGSGSIPACSPKSIIGTPPTPAATAAALMGLNRHHQQQHAAAAAAAAAIQMQQGIMQGLQQQLLLQQVQQQMAVQAHMAAAAAAAQAQMAPQVPCSMAAAAAAAAAVGMGPGMSGPSSAQHAAMMRAAAAGMGPMGPGGAMAGMPYGAPGGPRPGAPYPSFDGMHPLVKPNGEVVPPGLDLSFIS